MKLGRRFPRFAGLAAAASLVALLSACGGGGDTVYPDDQNRRTGTSTYDTGAAQGGVFGPEGLNLFGGGKDEQPSGGGPGIGVNAFLWRASLDTLSFMPLASADPFGGVIITEWHSPPESPDERFKLNVFILGRDLRADGVRATVFRQVRGDAGGWVDAEVSGSTGTDLENAILTRARQLRIAALQ